MGFETSTPGFWTPVVVSLIFTPVALLLAIASGGGGHGDYFFAKLLLPFATLSISLSLSGLGTVLALVQYPVYGVALGRANQRGQLLALSAVLALAHGFATLLSFLIPV